MNYSDIFNLLEPLGYEQTAIAWEGENTPDIFIRYYLVAKQPECNFNGEDKQKKSRYTFVVYDKGGNSFESIFSELQTKLVGKNGFKKFFNISDGYDTGHRYKRGDIYHYETR